AIAYPCVSNLSQALAGQKKQRVEHIYHLDVANDRIDVQVVLNKSENVKVAYPFSEALIGNPNVADVVPLTNQSINILGKKIGVTRLSLLDTKKQVLGIVDIQVTHDIDALRIFLRQSPEYGRIRATSVNGKVLLTGIAPNAVVMQRVVSLAEQFAPGDVTNAMSVAAPQQVLLEVRFIEADRTVVRGLGVNWAVGGSKIGGITGNGNLLNNSNGSTSAVLSDTGNGNFANNAIFNLMSGLAGANTAPFGTLAGQVLNGGVKADVFVSALEQQGLARSLAEPNLVALSGDTANFLAGGEFPFPVAGANNTITTEFKKFGIGLAFTPTVLANSQINLKIQPEVSEIDPTSSVTVNGVQVPGLSVRRASTTVELRDGQSFAIAGLLQGKHISNKQGIPWVDDVPVLGTLFRSASFQKNETDLVIIVTPRLVKPKIPGEKLATPLDNTLPANDPEFFLEGKQEVKTHRPAAPGEGYILDYVPGPQDAGFKGVK
ncbi:MAG: type II and III secretion system protein family protein, partial [Rhodomicrobium sp.]